MNAGAALDTFFLVNYADTVFVIGNRIHRTYLLTGTLQMCNCIVRTGIGTHSALFTFVGINVSSCLSHGNCAEFTGILACLTHTFPAVVGYGIGSNGTLLTGCADNLNYIAGILSAGGTQTLCQTYSLTDDFSFLVNTAPELSLRSRNHLIRNLLPLLLQLALPGQLCYLIKYVVL